MRLLIPDLLPGTNYSIQVRADDGSLQSEWSNVFVVETTADQTPPETPVWSNIADWVVNGDTFVAAWDALDLNMENNRDFSHYEIELSDGVKSVVVRVDNTSYTLTFAQNRIFFGTPKATVKARVRSVDAVGNTSPWNAQKSATNPPPSPVDSVSVNALYDAIDVNWEDSDVDDDFAGYRVQVSTTSASTGFNNVSFGPSRQYQHATTMFTTDHWFRVYAVDKFGSISSSVTSAAVRPKSSFTSDLTPPDTPTALSATLTNNANGIGAKASLSWSQTIPTENDVAGFRVRWRPVGETNYSQTDFTYDDRSGTIELQTAYKNHEFQIRSYDWAGNFSAWSSTVTATSPGNVAPDKTVGVLSTPDRTSIVYRWTPSAAEDLREYEAVISTSSTFASGNVTFRTGTSAALTVGGLTPETTYYMRVRAVDTAGSAGTWSDTHIKTTLGQITPGDIGAPTESEFDDLAGKVDDSIKTYVTEYSVNSSETVPPTTGWSTATPTRTPGTFIWIRTKVTYQDGTDSTTNPALLTGNTGAQGSQGIPGPPGTDGQDGSSLFTWIKYADTPTTGMADTPTGKTYMGVAYNKTTATESSNYADYSWSLIKGADGSQGPAGKGISNTVVNYAKATQGTNSGTVTGWGTTIPATTTGEFLWTRTVTTYTDSTTSTAYSVSAHGATGAQGNTGAAGRGITGTTVNYAKNTSGTSEPTTGWGASIPATSPGEFLWTRTVTTYSSAPTSITSYSVAAHGATGQQGIQGPPGEDGNPTYTWIKYSANADGTGLVDTPTASTIYIGIAYNKSTQTESTNKADYQWSLIQGPQGPAGEDGPKGDKGDTGNTGAPGVGISSITPYYRTVSAGSAAPAKPTTMTPAGWATTEPAYVDNTDLYRTDRIVYTNNDFDYTAVTKVSSYTAAVEAMAAANGKNKIIFSPNNATGATDPTDGQPYKDGDVWYKRDASGTVIGTWERVGGVWAVRKFGDATLDSLNVGKLVSGDVSAITINIKNTGAIKSDNYNTTNKTGWKLDASGLDIQSGSVRAETIKAGVLGGPSGAGVINVEAGTSLVLNGGYIKSNTNAGTTMATAEASGAGFFINEDGLFIGGTSRIKANALISDTLESTIITLGSGGQIKGGSWTLSNAGLSIPDGAIQAQHLTLQKGGANLIPAEWANFSLPPSFYEPMSVSTSGGVSGDVTIDITKGFIGNHSLKFNMTATGATGQYMQYNTIHYIPVDDSKTYIYSAYVYQTGGAANTIYYAPVLGGTGGTRYMDGQRFISATDTWVRLSFVFTPKPGETEVAINPRILFPNGTTGTGRVFYVDGQMLEEKMTNADTPSTFVLNGYTAIDGGIIKTGSIQSTQSAKDASGANIPNVAAWKIDTTGSAVLGDVLVRGSMTVGISGEGGNKSVIKSYNYQSGVAGWSILSDGSAEFNNATVRGNIDAGSITSGTLAAGRIGANTIDSTKVVTAGLDAGVIKFGTMSGDRIAANTITADKMLIGVGHNALVNGGFENHWYQPNWLTGSADVSFSHATHHRSGSRSLRVDSTNTLGITDAPVLLLIANGHFSQPEQAAHAKQGETWRFSFWAHAVTSHNMRVRAAMQYRDVNGVGSTQNNFNVKATNPINGWQRFTVELEATHANTGRVYGFIYLDSANAGGQVYIDDMELVRMTDGNLIVNGAIDGKTITGATLRTAASGERLVIEPGTGATSSQIAFHSGLGTETAPAYARAMDVPVSGASLLDLVGPEIASTVSPARISLYQNGSGDSHIRIEATGQEVYIASHPLSGNFVSGIISVDSNRIKATGGQHVWDTYNQSSVMVLNENDIHLNVNVNTTHGFTDTSLAGGGNTNAVIGDGGLIKRATSSIRYKENVEPIDLATARKALDLEAVTYTLKEEASNPRTYPGFIAEQADAAGMNLWVTYTADGTVDGFRYSELVVAHNVLIEDLVSRIEYLEERLEQTR